VHGTTIENRRITTGPSLVVEDAGLAARSETSRMLKEPCCRPGRRHNRLAVMTTDRRHQPSR
jgi:hypothetical protein